MNTKDTILQKIDSGDRVGVITRDGAEVIATWFDSTGGDDNGTNPLIIGHDNDPRGDVYLSELKGARIRKSGSVALKSGRQIVFYKRV